ncbi:MAG TPA: hypothetical protein VH413_08980 [Verrucomicrobiae bacterium]|jgi:hypothetical protein|nr:hypothetical protein [Verrucomicrobiae bacterium]
MLLYFVIMFFFPIALLAILTFGLMRLLCTRGPGNIIPGLLFGLPTIYLCFSYLTFWMVTDGYAVGSLAIPLLIIGGLVVWRGFRTGRKRRDIFSAVVIFGCLIAGSFVAIECPEIARTMFLPFFL